MVFLAKQSMRDSNLHVAIKYVPKQTIFDFQSGSKMQQVGLLHCTVYQYIRCSSIVFLLTIEYFISLYICLLYIYRKFKRCRSATIPL